MDGYCTLDSLRQQADQLNIDTELFHYENFLVAYINRTLGNIPARVINIGSTHEKRRTYVVEPNDQARPFPPDIDLCVILEDEEIPSGLVDKVYAPFGAAGHLASDEKHGKIVCVKGTGDFNADVSIYTQDSATKFNEVYYVDNLDDALDDDFRIEAKALKLSLMRAGCYGNYNYGVKGIAVEEMIRQHGGVGDVFSWLHSELTSNDGKGVPRLHYGPSKENLFQNVSHNVWDRLLTMLTVYQETNSVKSDSFNMGYWRAWLSFKQTEYVDISRPILCSPASCGRDGNGIRNDLKKIVRDLASGKSGLDFNIVHYQGINLKQPHSVIYAALRRDRIDDNFFREFNHEILALQGYQLDDLGHVDNLMGAQTDEEYALLFRKVVERSISKQMLGSEANINKLLKSLPPEAWEDIRDS